MPTVSTVFLVSCDTFDLLNTPLIATIELTENAAMKNDIKTFLDNQQRLLQLLDQTSKHHLSNIAKNI